MILEPSYVHTYSVWNITHHLVPLFNLKLCEAHKSKTLLHHGQAHSHFHLVQSQKLSLAKTWGDSQVHLQLQISVLTWTTWGFFPLCQGMKLHLQTHLYTNTKDTQKPLHPT